MQFFLHESIMHLWRGIAKYVKMNMKTRILALRYLNVHTVAILCAILYVIMYIYFVLLSMAAWRNGIASDYESGDCRFDPCGGHIQRGVGGGSSLLCHKLQEKKSPKGCLFAKTINLSLGLFFW